jgi:hypothetical protein
MWSFLKHYDEAQPGKRKTASATPTGDWKSLMTFRILLLLFQSSRALSVFNFISTDRGLKIIRPVTIQNKPKSWSHAIVMRKMIFSSENPPKNNKIKKHDIPDLHRSLHRIRFYSEFCLQFRQHGNVSIIKMWSFLILLFQSSRALSVFNFISTDRGLKIGRPVTIQNKPKSWCTKKE